MATNPPPPLAKPRLKFVKWVRFAPGVSSWRKPNHRTWNLIPWIAGPIQELFWRRKILGESCDMKGKMELNGFRGFAVNLPNRTRLATTIAWFWVRWTRFRIPQHVGRWKKWEDKKDKGSALSLPSSTSRQPWLLLPPSPDPPWEAVQEAGAEELTGLRVFPEASLASGSW
jgi:hypothetical protein